MTGRGQRELRDLADAVCLRPLEEVAPFPDHVRDPTDHSRWRRCRAAIRMAVRCEGVGPVAGRTSFCALQHLLAWCGR